LERFMPRDDTTEIYKIKKSTEGFIVSFRRGTVHGIRPGMQLTVLNEDGFRVGVVEVLVSGESGIKLGCKVSIPQPMLRG
jgi:hypothetical protein